MAKVIFETKNRDVAHQKQAEVISDGSAPLACCTEHVERGDTTIVWDDTPTLSDIQKLPRRKESDE